jgi:hypothetical protein
MTTLLFHIMIRITVSYPLKYPGSWNRRVPTQDIPAFTTHGRDHG